MMYPQLGVNSLSEVSYEYNVEVDDNCDYHFTVNFSHNENFPVGTAETCVPSDDVSDYDGLPILAGRWFYEEYPAYITEATGMQHLSLDFNPCGREYDHECLLCMIWVASSPFVASHRFLVLTSDL